MPDKLRQRVLSIIDDLMTVGLDPNTASDIYGVLADHENRLPTMILSQADPSCWVKVMPEDCW